MAARTKTKRDEQTIYPIYVVYGKDRRRGIVIRTGDRLRDRFGESALLPAGALLDNPTPAGKR